MVWIANVEVSLGVGLASSELASGLASGVETSGTAASLTSADVAPPQAARDPIMIRERDCFRISIRTV